MAHLENINNSSKFQLNFSHNDNNIRTVQELESAITRALAKNLNGVGHRYDSINIDECLANEIKLIHETFSKLKHENFAYHFENDFQQKKDEVINKFNEDIITVDEMHSMLFDIEDELAEATKEYLEKYKDTLIAQAKKDHKSAKKKAKQDAWAALTGGRSRVFEGEGNKLINLGGARSQKGKFPGEVMGKGLESIGETVKALSGYLGILSKAMSIYANNIRFDTKVVELMQREDQLNFETAMACYNADFQATMTAVGAAGAMANAAVSTYGGLAQEGLTIGANGYAQAHQVVTKSMFDIVEGAFLAGHNAVNIMGDHKKFEISQKYEKEKLAATIRGASATIAAANTIAAISKGEQEKINAINKKELQREMDVEVFNYNYKQAGEIFGISGLTNLLGINKVKDEFMTNQTQHLMYQNLAEMNRTKLYAEIDRRNASLRADYANKVASLKNQQADIVKQEKQLLIGAAQQINDAWIDYTQEMSKRFLEQEDASFKMNRSMGYSDLELLEKTDTLFTKQMYTAWWGKNLPEMQKTQMTFQEETGRNIQYNRSDFDMTYANELIFNDNIPTQINSVMETSNKIPSEMGQILNNVFRVASVQALNGVKISNDISKTINQTMKFQFKNGVHGFMGLHLWAEKMKFNMEKLPDLINLVRNDGNISDTIDKMANISYLGGDFMLNSDPIMAAYESYNDPEALAKRFNSMLQNIGRFSKEIGETQFSMAEELTLAAFGQYTSQNVEDIKRQIRKQNKINVLKNLIKPEQNFNEREMDVIGANAEWDVQKQQWVIEGKNVEDLTKEDVKTFLPEEIEKQEIANEEKLIQYVMKMRTTEQMAKGYQDEMVAQLQKSEWLFERNELLRLIAQQISIYTQEYGKYSNNFTKNLVNLTQSFASLLTLFRQGNTQIDEVVNHMHKMVLDIKGVIVDDFKRGAAQITTAMGTVIRPLTSYFNVMNHLNNHLFQYQKELDAWKLKCNQYYSDLTAAQSTNPIDRRRHGNASRSAAIDSQMGRDLGEEEVGRIIREREERTNGAYETTYNNARNSVHSIDIDSEEYLRLIRQGPPQKPEYKPINTHVYSKGGYTYKNSKNIITLKNDIILPQIQTYPLLTPYEVHFKTQKNYGKRGLENKTMRDNQNTHLLNPLSITIEEGYDGYDFIKDITWDANALHTLSSMITECILQEENGGRCWGWF